MAKKLERVLSQLKTFTNGDVKLKMLFEDLKEEVLRANAFNIEAQIEVGRISVESFDITDLMLGEDYDILTTTLVDIEGNVFVSEEEAEKYYQRIYPTWESFFDIRKEFILFSEQDGDIQGSFDSMVDVTDYVLENLSKFEEGFYVRPGFCLFDAHRYEYVTTEDEVFLSEEDAIKLAEEMYESKIEDLINELEEIPDEILWNTAWNFNDDYVSIDLAKRCGLAVIIDNKTNKRYLALTSCGQDLSPKLVAYKALRFGFVDETDLHQFETRQGREYFEHVVGKELADEVYKKIGIYESIQLQRA